MMNLEDQYDRIFKYLYFRFRDRHVAEDMTQEAFLCRQTALELSGSACPLCRDYHNGAGDWAAEILRAAGRIKRR